jgi:hypothetical protein
MKIRNNGTGLENTVAEIYRDLGYKNVRQNIKFYKKDGHQINAQIDLAYEDELGSIIYVECKSHRFSKVKLEEFSRFAAVLNMLRVQKRPFIYRGELVTDNYFDDRTKIAAESERIKLIDVISLKRLEMKRKSGINVIIPLMKAIEIYGSDGIGAVIRYGLKRMLPLKDQIYSNMK